MANIFKNWIFNQLPKYHQINDSYKDINQDGLLKRFLQVPGLELDENIIPFIDNFLSLIDFVNCDEKYLPLIGSILGYPPSLDGTSETYRKLLAYVVAIYKIKGTLQSFQILFNLLGLSVIIVEDTPGNGIHYDQTNVKYDNTPMQQYDTSCDNCSGYSLTYSIIDVQRYPLGIIPQNVLDGLETIICFLNPINAIRKSIMPSPTYTFKYGVTQADSTGPTLTEAQLLASVDATFTAGQELTGTASLGSNASAHFLNTTDKVSFIQVPNSQAVFIKWSEVANAFQQNMPIDALYSVGSGIWFKSSRAGQTIYITRYQTTFIGTIILSR